MSSSAPVRSRALRWAVASIITLAMLLATTGIAVFAQTGSAGGPVFAPATSIAYAEARLDLPGGQHDALAELVGHLPGFADPGAFDAKVDELLDQVVSQASSGGASWTGDIKPWSNGQFAIALLGLPAPSASASTSNEQPSLVIALGVKDRAALESRLSSFLTTQPISTEDYAGATVTTVGTTASYAVTDQYLLVAPVAADVKASLDVLAGTVPSLAADDTFTAAAARVPADHLAAFYVAVESLRPLIESQLTAQPGAEQMLQALSQLPAWISGYAQAASDHLTVSLDIQWPASLPVPAVRETDLATHFPSGTLLYLEARDLGATLHPVLAQILAQVPAENRKDLDQIERLLGMPLEELLDPVQDAALGITFVDGVVQGGIAATISDPAAAQGRVASVLTLIRLLQDQGAPITVDKKEVQGVPVTTVTFTDAAGTQALGLPIPPAFSIALANDRLYVGLGDFAADALTQDPAASLASDTRYANAVTEVGTPNSGLLYVDLAGAQSALEGLVTDSNYQTDIKPWLDALDYLVLSGTASEDVITAKALLFVR